MSEKLYYVDNISIFRVIYFSLKHRKWSPGKDDLELQGVPKNMGHVYWDTL